MSNKEILMVAPSMEFGYSGTGKAHIVTSVAKAVRNDIYMTCCGKRLHGPTYKEEKCPVQHPRIFGFDSCLSCIWITMNNTEGTRQSFEHNMATIRKQREAVDKQFRRTWSNNRRHCPHISRVRHNKWRHPIRTFYLYLSNRDQFLGGK